MIPLLLSYLLRILTVGMWTAVEKMVIQNSMSQRNSTADPVDTATSYISAALAAANPYHPLV